MDIPIKASVMCNEEDCGQTICVIVNPINDELTHVVVEDKEAPYQERIIPIELVEESTPKMIRLSCSKAEFQKMENFIEHRYIPAEKAYGVFPLVQKVYIPFSTVSFKIADVARERVPDGGIAFHPGTLIEATDGEVGKVDEFLVDPVSEHITHLVMKEGHLWNKREIAIPASDIDHIEKDVVYLKISKTQIEALPTPESLLQKDPR